MCGTLAAAAGFATGYAEAGSLLAAADVAWYALEAFARRGVKMVGPGAVATPVRDREKVPA